MEQLFLFFLERRSYNVLKTIVSTIGTKSEYLKLLIGFQNRQKKIDQSKRDKHMMPIYFIGMFYYIYKTSV